VQLKETIEDKKKTAKGAREVQQQVDGEDVLVPDNTSSVLSTVLNTIINEFEHECLEEAVRLVNAHPIRQSSDDCIPDRKYSIPGLPGTMFLVHQVWANWFIVRRGVWDADIPGALVVDAMGLGKTLTSVAAALRWKLATEKVEMGLPQLIFWGNTLAEWVKMVPNNFPRIIGEERKWYPLRRYNSVPRRLMAIQKTPQQGHTALTSALQPILVVTMPGVAETFKSDVEQMT
jgi:hypothetical protein